jgi:hypothetical protein
MEARMKSRLPLILSVIALFVASAAFVVSLNQVPQLPRGVATTAVMAIGTPTPGGQGDLIPTGQVSMATPLPDTSTLAGQLMCAATPGAHLTVDIFVNDSGGSAVRMFSIVADENGRWLMAGLSPGQYYVYSGTQSDVTLPERTPAVLMVDLKTNESRDMGAIESGMCQ